MTALLKILPKSFICSLYNFLWLFLFLFCRLIYASLLFRTLITSISILLHHLTLLLFHILRVSGEGHRQYEARVGKRDCNLDQRASATVWGTYRVALCSAAEWVEEAAIETLPVVHCLPRPPCGSRSVPGHTDRAFLTSFIILHMQFKWTLIL